MDQVPKKRRRTVRLRWPIVEAIVYKVPVGRDDHRFELDLQGPSINERHRLPVSIINMQESEWKREALLMFSKYVRESLPREIERYWKQYKKLERIPRARLDFLMRFLRKLPFMSERRFKEFDVLLVEGELREPTDETN